MDFEGTKAAILKVEQAITLMDSRMQHKLRPDQREALANAILSSGAQDDLLFHRRTARTRPALWTLGGLAAAIRMQWAKRVRKQQFDDECEQLSLWAAAVRRSGARRLLIAMLIGLVCGLINLGLPVELAIQGLRDKARPIQASGEIVVVAKDELSRQAFGQLPWARSYDAILLDRLRELGARRIVFNEFFDHSLDPIDDQKFIDALRRAKGKVWLSGYAGIDELTGQQVDYLPMGKFGMSCCIVSNEIRFNSFGMIESLRLSASVGGKIRPSTSIILAEKSPSLEIINMDTALQAKSIPAISAKSILNGSIDRSRIEGKNIIIGLISNNPNDQVHILGQGKVPSIYSVVIAAENIRNGLHLYMGWIPIFLFALIICIVCIFNANHKMRLYCNIVGIISIFIMIFFADEFGVHFEIVPALVMLLIFGLRDQMQRKILTAAMADPISGLPCTGELTYLASHERCIVAALKVERFTMHLNGMDICEQRDFVRAVAARINIVFPDQVIHQGDDGLFVWLIPPNLVYEPLSYIAQLNALFRIPIGAAKGAHDVGIAVGFGSNLSEPFAARLAVATDRARISLFGTLTSVQ